MARNVRTVLKNTNKLLKVKLNLELEWATLNGVNIYMNEWNLILGKA